MGDLSSISPDSSDSSDSSSSTGDDLVSLNAQIPRGLWRKAKMLAAARETSLKQVVIDALKGHIPDDI